ncbi:uracil phosphoribosyltransferase [Neisseria sp.]|uniref:uracil phosphoribosyltransferase n=1 Tax=Neisseria sp. TaxID=192066 RepID=UPI002899DC24|nr:uracil phosphoribosyltransferase [Neisseria sp.]
MSIFILQEHLPAHEQYWIEHCKSSSMKIGYKLRQAHYVLGLHMSKAIYTTNSKQSKFAVWILMRAGLPFGLGISDGLEKQGCDVAIYFIDEQIDSDTITSSNGRTIILADAVINSGKSIEHIYKNLPENIRQSMIVTTTVIPSNAVPRFEKFNLMTVRVSHNQYQGAKVSTIQNGKGPDTGDRLFGTFMM